MFSTPSRTSAPVTAPRVVVVPTVKLRVVALLRVSALLLSVPAPASPGEYTAPELTVIPDEPRVPVPERLAPELMATVPSPLREPVTLSSPALIVNPPAWVLPVPPRTSAPVEPLVTVPPPAIAPARVRVPAPEMVTADWKVTGQLMVLEPEPRAQVCA